MALRPAVLPTVLHICQLTVLSNATCDFLTRSKAPFKGDAHGAGERLGTGKVFEIRLESPLESITRDSLERALGTGRWISRPKKITLKKKEELYLM